MEEESSDRRDAQRVLTLSSERPLTLTAAIFWFICATFGTFVLLFATRSLWANAATGNANLGLVGAVVCQAAVYVFTIVVVARVHLGNRTLLHALSFRKTHVGFYFIGALLGVCLQAPAEVLLRLVDLVAPVAQETLRLQAEMLRMDSTVSRIMIPFVAMGLGPLVEEMLFRGVLFAGMRRCYGVCGAVIIATVLFAAAHASVRLALPLLIVGGVLTYLRAASGSLWPSLVAHTTYNAVPVVALAAGWMRFPEGFREDPDPFPLFLSFGGVLASVLLVALVIILSRRSELALRARIEDSK